MSLNLYRLKPASARAIEPLIAGCVRHGVNPDTLTLAALPVALLGAAAIVASPLAGWLLLLVPPLAGIRLIFNLLDGAVARRTGRIHARGELANELVDRLCDVLLLGAPAFLPGVEPRLVLGGVLLAVLASYVGITVRAAGGPRLYGGILSKPGRMLALAVAAVAALSLGTVAWTAFGIVLVVGAGLTLLARLRGAMGALA